MNKKLLPKLLGIGAAVLMILSTLLPFASLTFWGYTETANLFDICDGRDSTFLAVIVILSSLVLAASALLNKPVLVMVFDAISTLAFLVQVIDYAGGDAAEYTSYGFGFYLFWLTAIAGIVAAVMMIKAKKAEAPRHPQSCRYPTKG